jgi:hypothetical protein
MASHWYYAKGRKKHGPLAGRKLKQLAASGEIEADDLVWKTGMQDWKPARSIKGLLQPAKSVAPATDPNGSHSDTQPPPKPNANADGDQVSGTSPPPIASNEFNLNSLVGSTRKLLRETWDKIRQGEVKSIPRKHFLFGCVGLAGLGTGLLLCLFLAVGLFWWFLTSPSTPGIPDEFGESSVYKITWEPHTVGDGDWYDRATYETIDYISPGQGLAVRFTRCIAVERGKRSTSKLRRDRNWDKRVFDGHAEDSGTYFRPVFKGQNKNGFICTLKHRGETTDMYCEISVSGKSAAWKYWGTQYKGSAYGYGSGFPDNTGTVEKVR